MQMAFPISLHSFIIHSKAKIDAMLCHCCINLASRNLSNRFILPEPHWKGALFEVSERARWLMNRQVSTKSILSDVCSSNWLQCLARYLFWTKRLHCKTTTNIALHLRLWCIYKRSLAWMMCKIVFGSVNGNYGIMSCRYRKYKEYIMLSASDFCFEIKPVCF